MSQHVRFSLSNLRKRFLIIGLVLLISSFAFFYWASVVDYDAQTVKTYAISTQDFLENGEYMSHNFSTLSGYVVQETVQEYCVGKSIRMQAGDELGVEWDYGTNLGKSHIVLYNILKIIAQSEDFTPNLASFTCDSDNTFVSIYLTVPFDGNFTNLRASLSAPQSQSIPPATVYLDHYERPQWLYFGTGVALSSLAVIPIFLSKKSMPKPT